MWSSRHSSDVQRQGKEPDSSNFAQTCNLLSRYMKEKGSLRDLNLEIGGKVESLEALVKPVSSLSASASTSKNLVTDSRNSAQPSSEHQPSMDSFPLTRIDSSITTVEDASNKASTRMLVFDDYPADKVRELVSVAKKASSQMSYGVTSNTIQEKPDTVTSTSTLREGLPPRPHAANGKQPVGILSNPCKEKMNTTGSADGASCSKSLEQDSPQSEANGSDLPIARRSSLHRFLEKRKDRAAVRGAIPQSRCSCPFSKDDEQLDLNTFPQKE